MNNSRNSLFLAKDESNFLGIANKMALSQVIFLGIDIGCNLMVDSTSSDPMVGFIIFIIQVLAILINLISFLMISSHEGIQTKFVRSKTQIHNMNAVTMISYLALTIGWYIWSLRRSWPAAGDQFSYSFLPKRSSSTNATESLPFGSGFDNLKEDREFYTLWSPGYIALFTIQRTMALLYYGVDLLSISVLVNEGPPGKIALEPQAEKELKMRSVSDLIHTMDSVGAQRLTDGISQHQHSVSTSDESIPYRESAGKSVRGRRAQTSWEGRETLGI